MIYAFIFGFSIVIASNIFLLRALAKAKRERVALNSRLQKIKKDLYIY